MHTWCTVNSLLPKCYQQVPRAALQRCLWSSKVMGRGSRSRQTPGLSWGTARGHGEGTVQPPCLGDDDIPTVPSAIAHQPPASAGPGQHWHALGWGEGCWLSTTPFGVRQGLSLSCNALLDGDLYSLMLFIAAVPWDHRRRRWFRLVSVWKKRKTERHISPRELLSCGGLTTWDLHPTLRDGLHSNWVTNHQKMHQEWVTNLKGEEEVLHYRNTHGHNRDTSKTWALTCSFIWQNNIQIKSLSKFCFRVLS